MEGDSGHFAHPAIGKQHLLMYGVGESIAEKFVGRFFEGPPEQEGSFVIDEFPFCGTEAMVGKLRVISPRPFQIEADFVIVDALKLKII